MLTQRPPDPTKVLKWCSRVLCREQNESDPNTNGIAYLYILWCTLLLRALWLKYKHIEEHHTLCNVEIRRDSVLSNYLFLNQFCTNQPVYWKYVKGFNHRPSGCCPWLIALTAWKVSWKCMRITKNTKDQTSLCHMKIKPMGFLSLYI